MTCIKCGAASRILWEHNRDRIRECTNGHTWESIELVTGPVHEPDDRLPVPSEVPA